MTRLVLCADDAGLAAPLSRRIASLLGAGRLTATSLLACAPAFGEAVAALRAADSTASPADVAITPADAAVTPGLSTRRTGCSRPATRSRVPSVDPPSTTSTSSMAG